MEQGGGRKEGRQEGRKRGIERKENLLEVHV